MNWVHFLVGPLTQDGEHPTWIPTQTQVTIRHLYTSTYTFDFVLQYFTLISIFIPTLVKVGIMKPNMIKETFFLLMLLHSLNEKNQESALNAGVLYIQIKNQVLLTSAKCIINLVVYAAYFCPIRARKSSNSTDIPSTLYLTKAAKGASTR